MSRTDVSVAGFDVVDGSVQEVVDAIIDCERHPTIAYALHVGGINSRTDVRFRAAMNRADVTYADGIAVVLLARLAGARSIERAPTTDVGWAILREFARDRGRTPTVALVGGAPRTSGAAGRTLEEHGAARVVYTTHGFHEDYTHVLQELRSTAPDVILVGMGMPREAFWVDAHADELSAEIILTCGGWFGFLTGTEERAPSLLQRAGLEWTWRLRQDPARLWKRYLKGAAATVHVGWTTVMRGISDRHANS